MCANFGFGLVDIKKRGRGRRRKWGKCGEGEHIGKNWLLRAKLGRKQSAKLPTAGVGAFHFLILASPCFPRSPQWLSVALLFLLSAAHSSLPLLATFCGVCRANSRRVPLPSFCAFDGFFLPIF